MPRTTPIFTLADQFVEQRATIDPLFATGAGIAGSDHLLPDLSAERTSLELRTTIDQAMALEGAACTDAIDEVAKAAIGERLAAHFSILQGGELRRTFSVINSPLLDLRQVFELMPTGTEGEIATMAARLRAMPAALKSWRSTLRDVAVAGQLPAPRHVAGVADQAAVFGRGGFTDLATRAATLAFVDPTASGILEAAAAAEAACMELSEWMRTELLPRASAPEGVGEERYATWAKYYTGAQLDLDELFEWGYDELRATVAEMWVLARALSPGATSLRQVANELDADPRRSIVGTNALLARLEGFTAATIAQLDGVHFTIDPAIRRCEARLAPEGSAAAPYYVGPSEDLSRPGTTWFPTLGAERFSWWSIASTWYQEGVPGHHLQIATATVHRERLSRFQRLLGWTSGYGEGWALYAERLMDELGAFSDPGDRFGHLVDRCLRAARVVVDLGLHLGRSTPADFGEIGHLGDCSSQPFTPELAVVILKEWALQSPAMARSEVDRYLGMPAQAISYKVGERAFLSARAAARSRLGDQFSLKDFHAYALELGPLGLDLLTAQLAQFGSEATHLG